MVEARHALLTLTASGVGGASVGVDRFGQEQGTRDWLCLQLTRVDQSFQLSVLCTLTSFLTMCWVLDLKLIQVIPSKLLRDPCGHLGF